MQQQCSQGMTFPEVDALNLQPNDPLQQLGQPDLALILALVCLFLVNSFLVPLPAHSTQMPIASSHFYGNESRVTGPTQIDVTPDVMAYYT
jgi:hypothetical protein